MTAQYIHNVVGEDAVLSQKRISPYEIIKRKKVANYQTPKDMIEKFRNLK